MNELSNPSDLAQARLARRHRAEQRFQFYGLMAIIVSVMFLLFLLGSITRTSITAFSQHTVSLPIFLSSDWVDPKGDKSEQSLRSGSYNRVLQNGLQAQFPHITERAELRELFGLYSPVNASDVLVRVINEPELIDQNFVHHMPISDQVDLYLKGRVTQENYTVLSADLSLDFHDNDVQISSDIAVFKDIIERVNRSALTQSEQHLATARKAEQHLEYTLDRAEHDRLKAEIEQAERLAIQALAHVKPDSALSLTPQTESIFIKTDQGVIKLTEIAFDGRSAQGFVILPITKFTSNQNTLWTLSTPANIRAITDRQIIWTRELQARGLVKNRFNFGLLTNADSREPEIAGVLGSILGSALTMFVTMFLSVPIGVATAIYLEEFAPKNRWRDLIEVNINNLAAIPSIVFGLLGVAILINGFGLPRSAPLIGGMVLALMTLPTVVIASRVALKAVPDSIRQAALAVGASKTQTVFHHVLPMARSGILTGTIIGMAQAFGETAPLLMIGMVAFIADPPSLSLSGLVEPATVMPVQIYIWSTSAERAFEARTAAAILILLVMIISFNALAIYLRQRFQGRV